LALQVIEREAKRAARKKAAEERAKAASDGDGEDPVQAAIARAKAKKDAQENA
jgi:electron transport complex protein RnfC